MTKTLGKEIRERREALGMSQSEFAKKVGVQTSHVAFIENGQRRPSIALLKRMARALRADPRRLFVLSHPEAKYLFDEDGEERRRRSVEGDPWQQFLSRRALLKRYKVTASELKLLKHVSLLADVSSARDFLFILNTVRQAADPDR